MNTDMLNGFRWWITIIFSRNANFPCTNGRYSYIMYWLSEAKAKSVRNPSEQLIYSYAQLVLLLENILLFLHFFVRLMCDICFIWYLYKHTNDKNDQISNADVIIIKLNWHEKWINAIAKCNVEHIFFWMLLQFLRPHFNEPALEKNCKSKVSSQFVSWMQFNFSVNAGK